MSYARIEGLLRSHAAKKITLAEVSELIDLLTAERTEEARVYSITRDEDAARMRELDALVAEPVTVERLRDVYQDGDGIGACPSVAGIRAVALAIFAAQLSKPALRVGYKTEYNEPPLLADELAHFGAAIAANQRAAVEGLGEPSGSRAALDESAQRDAVDALLRAEKSEAELADYKNRTGDLAREIANVHVKDVADARKWREAVEGVGDVERYARVAWETQSCRGPWEDSAPAMSRDIYRSEARAILAAFRARALSDGAIQATVYVDAGIDDWDTTRKEVRAALDFACSDVEVAKAEGADVYECEQCSAKPGAPTLCGGCLDARQRAGDRWKGPREPAKAAAVEPLPPFVPVDVSALEAWIPMTTEDQLLVVVLLELARRVNAAGLR